MKFKTAHELAKRSAPDVSGWTDAALQSAEAEISQSLIGPGIGQLERLALHEERKAIRAELVARAKPKSPQEVD